MNKNTGIVLSSLVNVVAVSLNNAISSAVRKADKPFGKIGEINMIAKAPEDGSDFDDIPIIGMADQSISLTFIAQEGQKTNGCIIFSEVKFIHKNGITESIKVLSNAYYSAKTTAWDVKLVTVAIDGYFYMVTVDSYGNVIGRIITRPDNGLFDSDLTRHHQGNVGEDINVTI